MNSAPASPGRGSARCRFTFHQSRQPQCPLPRPREERALPARPSPQGVFMIMASFDRMPTTQSASREYAASAGGTGSADGGMNERPAGLFGGMSIELGKVGIWRHFSGLTPAVVAEVEALGYGTIWVGGSPPGDLTAVEHLLDTTRHIAVATGIVNVWQDDAATVGASYHRITARHPGRFLLGLGIGHPEATDEYRQPYAALVSYLDQLDDLKVPVEGRVLAALGPRVL